MTFLYADRPDKTPGIDRQWRASKHAILAYYVGGWHKGESPLDALARALDVAPDDILNQLSNHSTDRDEFDLLSSCLGAGWLDLSELSIQDGVAFLVALVNKKLAGVPPEVRAYFGAPMKLRPFQNLHSVPRFSSIHGSKQ
jgi:hypothetical protein